MVRVLIVEDHALVRHAFVALRLMARSERRRVLDLAAEVTRRQR